MRLRLKDLFISCSSSTCAAAAFAALEDLDVDLAAPGSKHRRSARADPQGQDGRARAEMMHDKDWREGGSCSPLRR